MVVVVVVVEKVVAGMVRWNRLRMGVLLPRGRKRSEKADLGEYRKP
jgi:hypothetical protein